MRPRLGYSNWHWIREDRRQRAKHTNEDVQDVQDVQLQKRGEEKDVEASSELELRTTTQPTSESEPDSTPAVNPAVNPTNPTAELEMVEKESTPSKIFALLTSEDRSKKPFDQK